MLDNLTNKQKKILYIIGAIIIIGVVYFIYNSIDSKNSENINDEILVQNTENNISREQQNDEKSKIVIHVTGSVKNPGVVKIKEGDRIEDAIEAAGGLTEDADITNINLAYELEDGMKIKIPNVDSEPNENYIVDDMGQDIVDENNINKENKEENKKININKSNSTELQTLPGIGVSIAEKIITYREENGDFSDIAEIKNVSGIGENKYNEIKDLICIK